MLWRFRDAAAKAYWGCNRHPGQEAAFRPGYVMHDIPSPSLNGPGSLRHVMPNG